MPPHLLQFGTVTSTMDVARQELLSGRVKCDRLNRFNVRGVIAAEQSAGRGQRGRVWYAPYGESLCATYFFRHGLTDPQSAGGLSLLAGVAVADALRTAVEKVVQRFPFAIGLKWPNDVLLNGKKVGGILIELARMPDAEPVALIGVGINVHVRRFPPELAELATSLAVEMPGDTPQTLELAEAVIGSLDRLARIRRRQGQTAILRRWRAYDLTRGRRYRMEHEGITLEGMAEGIDDAGALLLRTDAGRLLTSLSASSLREL